MAARRRARRRDGAVAGAPETTARLLAPCLETGPLSGMLQGSEPREPSGSTTGSGGAPAASSAPPAHAASAAAASSGGDDPGPVREAFLGWYAARHDDVPQDAADAVDSILQEWGPGAYPAESSRYACSPHRIEMAAHLIRGGHFPEHANAALRLLPEWIQWCIGQSGLSGDFAARSRAAALTEAAASSTRRHMIRPLSERGAVPSPRVKGVTQSGRYQNCSPPAGPVA